MGDERWRILHSSVSADHHVVIYGSLKVVPDTNFVDGVVSENGIGKFGSASEGR
jgi:hypothetical protein